MWRASSLETMNSKLVSNDAIRRYETLNSNEQIGLRGMTTSKAVPLLILAVFILSIGTACRQRPKKYRLIDELDGGYVMRPECEPPADDCARKCYAREASSTCYGCCGDQRFLCDTQQPYNYSYCDGAR